jgi:hypothetical protein
MPISKKKSIRKAASAAKKAAPHKQRRRKKLGVTSASSQTDHQGIRTSAAPPRSAAGVGEDPLKTDSSQTRRPVSAPERSGRATGHEEQHSAHVDADGQGDLSTLGRRVAVHPRVGDREDSLPRQLRPRAPPLFGATGGVRSLHGPKKQAPLAPTSEGPERFL